MLASARLLHSVRGSIVFSAASASELLCPLAYAAFWRMHRFGVCTALAYAPLWRMHRFGVCTASQPTTWGLKSKGFNMTHMHGYVHGLVHVVVASLLPRPSAHISMMRVCCSDVQDHSTSMRSFQTLAMCPTGWRVPSPSESIGLSSVAASANGWRHRQWPLHACAGLELSS